jgi:hypothetical protein
MLYVMRIDKTRVVITGKCTAFVPGHKGSFDGRRHGPGLATDIQRFTLSMGRFERHGHHRIGLSGAFHSQYSPCPFFAFLSSKLSPRVAR